MRILSAEAPTKKGASDATLEKESRISVAKALILFINSARSKKHCVPPSVVYREYMRESSKNKTKKRKKNNA